MMVPVHHDRSLSHELEESLVLSTIFPDELVAGNSTEDEPLSKSPERQESTVSVNQGSDHSRIRDWTIESKAGMPAQLHRSPLTVPHIHRRNGVGSVNQQHGAGHAAEMREVENSSTRLGSNPEIVRRDHETTHRPDTEPRLDPKTGPPAKLQRHPACHWGNTSDAIGADLVRALGEGFSEPGVEGHP